MHIELKEVSKSIKGINVLEDINMELYSGNIYGIVGTNGSGKTMLLRMIAGLIVQDQGVISVDRQKLHEDISFPPNMGIVIEKPELLNHLSGLENLKLLAEINGTVSTEQIGEFMKLFSLDPESKMPIRKYSLGMKQKLGIIQAIMENQQLLVLDEPFNALDEDTVTRLKDLFLKYREEGRLIILTSHHAEDIKYLCDEVIYLKNGQVYNIKDLNNRGDNKIH